MRVRARVEEQHEEQVGVGAEGGEGNELEVPASEIALPKDGEKLTPMMRQYLETKALHPDAILFFRLGDFYEMFFEDAVKAAEILQITLTSRAKGSDRIPMCGVPYHSARRYIAKLIETGLKVAICEQVEEAGTGPGIVRREVIRIITPGMVLDEEVLESRENNFLAAICLGDERCGAALLDASTGEFQAFEAESLDELALFLSEVSPREVLFAEGFVGTAAAERLLSSFARRPAVGTVDRAAFDLSRAPGAAPAALPGRLARRVRALRAPARDRRRGRSAALPARHPEDRGGARRSDLARPAGRAAAPRRELAREPRGAEDAPRRLAAGLAARGARPHLHRHGGAQARALAHLAARAGCRRSRRGSTRWRSSRARASSARSSPPGCARSRTSSGSAGGSRSERATRATSRRSASRSRRCPGSPRRSGGARRRCSTGSQVRSRRCPTSRRELERAIADEPPVTLKEGGLFQRGYHAQLDELVELSTSGKDFLLKIETREKERTGISSLKVRYNKVFGYYLEITRANLHLVPPEYIRKQTTVGSERFVTPELKEYEEKVLTAEEKRCALELELFEQLRAKVVARAAQLRAAAEAVATGDALLSFARAAAEYGYSRPQIDDSEVLEITGGRHPVVERMLDREVFVPNDVRLDRKDSQILVITGPNMAGKSTVMRQVALIALMAQAGSFVPAKAARIGLCDRIFTRVGAADNLAKGQSTFMVEMTETANILHNATRKSLVLLDEIGRGTSTFDGLSIAWAVAEHLHDRVGARTLFATHYHELCDLAREKVRVRNCSIAVKEDKGKVTFLRKLIVGATNRSYGIEVAKLAGLPPEVVGRAREILGNLESGELDDAGRPRVSHGRGGKPERVDQLGLFVSEPAPALSTEKKQVLDELGAVSLDGTTPLEALNLLAKWKKALRG